MKKCPECGAENALWRIHCVNCKANLRHPSPEERATKPDHIDDGFDAAGFALGMTTGMPFSPSRGFSGGALLGSMLHGSEHEHGVKGGEGIIGTPAPDSTPSYSPPDPPSAPDPAPSYSAPDPTPSYSAPDPTPSSSGFDSGSFSSGFDGGGFDSGGGGGGGGGGD